jgi:hypothetical protein
MVLNSLPGFHSQPSSAPHDGANFDRAIFPVWTGPAGRAIVSKAFPVPTGIERMSEFYRKFGYFSLRYLINCEYYLD